MKELYVKDSDYRYYKVIADNLEKAIEQIHKYEIFIYDLYGGDTWTDMDTWGWWNYYKYEIINYDDIEDDETIFDLTDYEYTFPQEFCKQISKEDLYKNGKKDATPPPLRSI